MKKVFLAPHKFSNNWHAVNGEREMESEEANSQIKNSFPILIIFFKALHFLLPPSRLWTVNSRKRKLDSRECSINIFTRLLLLLVLLLTAWKLLKTFHASFARKRKREREIWKRLEGTNRSSSVWKTFLSKMKFLNTQQRTSFCCCCRVF